MKIGEKIVRSLHSLASFFFESVDGIRVFDMVVVVLVVVVVSAQKEVKKKILIKHRKNFSNFRIIDIKTRCIEKKRNTRSYNNYYLCMFVKKNQRLTSENFSGGVFLQTTSINSSLRRANIFPANQNT